MSKQQPINWLRPSNDFIFKLLFGSDDDVSKELLLAFCNDLFNVPTGQSLVNIEMLNPILNKGSITDKLAILDVKARVVGYGFINLEMQVNNQKNIHKRSLYYASKLIEEQMGEGEEYKKLKKVITINVMDFYYFSSDTYVNQFGLRGIRESAVYPDDLMNIYFIEMPKFIGLAQHGKIHPDDRMAKWLRFLTNTEDTRWFEMVKQDPIIEKAVDKLRRASLDPETRMQYEAREKALEDIASIRGEALEEGALIKVQEIAKKLILKGMELEFIVEMTGLSKSEVTKLKDEIGN